MKLPTIAGRFFCVALTAAAIVAILAPPASAEGPRLEGWTANFEILDPPAPGPEEAFTDADGDVLTLDDFKGKVLVLNFWATWCAPCVREMPELDALQKELGADDFEVVAISVDRGGMNKVEPFWKKAGLQHMEIYLDKSNKFMRASSVRVMPTTLIIDASGKVRAIYKGAAHWTAPEIKDLINYYRAQT